MTPREWQDVVRWLNTAYLGQQISPETAALWYVDLDRYDVGDIWLALRRLRLDSRFMPDLSEIRAGVIVYRRELAEQAASQQIRQSQSRKGTPMPPETKQAMEILKDSVAGKVDGKQARQMIDVLATQLEERLAREQLMRLDTGPPKVEEEGAR
jgi:hypothetical protein